jgi:hypothetical protein
MILIANMVPLGPMMFGDRFELARLAILCKVLLEDYNGIITVSIFGKPTKETQIVERDKNAS